MRITRLAISLAVFLSACAVAAAQDRKPLSPGEQSQYVVSAKSGVVSVVEGAAMLKRQSFPLAVAKSTQLVEGDELSPGDSVSTGADGRVEILLNPGCFLRVNENSEVVYATEDFLAAQKIKLGRGSAIVEAAALDDDMTVLTPKATFRIYDVGLYRFDVAADGTAQMAVRKGRGEVDGVAVKSGKTATVSQSSPVVAKLNGKETDTFDAWSKDRARTLIASNKKLSNRTLKDTLARGSLFNSWVYDPFCRCYTFLPSGYGFSSPYGWGYSHYNPYWWYPSGYYWGGGTHASGGSSSGGSPSGGSSGGGSSAGGATGSGHHHRGGSSPVDGGGSRGGGGNVGGGGHVGGGAGSSPPASSPGRGSSGAPSGGFGGGRDASTPAHSGGGAARKP